MAEKTKKEIRQRKHRKIKAKLFNAERRPRLSVFRSSRHIYVQLIDDKSGKTLISAGDLEMKSKAKKEGEKNLSNKVASAFEVGKLIAKKAIEKKIEKVFFDRASYKYHGRVKALADGAREGGLKF